MSKFLLTGSERASVYCAIFVFIPDDFIKYFLNKNPHLLDRHDKDVSLQDIITGKNFGTNQK
jgi:hypothetical protein